MIDQATEAADRHAVVTAASAAFAFRGVRDLGWSDGREPRLPRRRPIVIMEQKRSPGLAQVPLDIIAKHAKEHMRPDPWLDPVMHRADLQVDGFHSEKRPLHPCEILVGPD